MTKTYKNTDLECEGHDITLKVKGSNPEEYGPKLEEALEEKAIELDGQSSLEEV